MHMQHVACQVVQTDILANKFDRVEITFILALFHWLKPLTHKGREETRAPTENLWQRASKNFYSTLPNPAAWSSSIDCSFNKFCRLDTNSRLSLKMNASKHCLVEIAQERKVNHRCHHISDTTHVSCLVKFLIKKVFNSMTLSGQFFQTFKTFFFPFFFFPTILHIAINSSVYKISWVTNFMSWIFQFTFQAALPKSYILYTFLSLTFSKPNFINILLLAKTR